MNIKLANFEQWTPDFQLMRVLNGFGKVTVNRISEYVRSGKQSAKLQPLGRLDSKQNPFVYIPLFSEQFKYDFADISKLEKVQYSIYNAQDAPREIAVGFIAQIISVLKVNKTCENFITVKPGWNDVILNVDVGKLSLELDVNNAAGIYFAFKNTHSIKLSDSPIFYLDDLTLIYKNM